MTEQYQISPDRFSCMHSIFAIRWSYKTLLWKGKTLKYYCETKKFKKMGYLFVIPVAFVGVCVFYLIKALFQMITRIWNYWALFWIHL